MNQPLRILKALADGSRSRVLLLLEAGPLCLCELTEVLALAPSTLSRHLQILAEAGLVTGRKRGRWRYYSWVGPEGTQAAHEALEWIRRHRDGWPDAEQDARRRAVVLQESTVPHPTVPPAAGGGPPEPTAAPSCTIDAEDSLPHIQKDAQGDGMNS